MARRTRYNDEERKTSVVTMTEQVEQPQQPGRNFLEAIKGVKGYDRKNAMQVGDYIVMPWKIFRTWSATQLNGEQEDRATFPIEGDARVSVLGILKEKDKPMRAVVEANGVRRNVDASLFFNFGIIHGAGEPKAGGTVSGASPWDERGAG